MTEVSPFLCWQQIIEGLHPDMADSQQGDCHVTDKVDDDL